MLLRRFRMSHVERCIFTNNRGKDKFYSIKMFHLQTDVLKGPFQTGNLDNFFINSVSCTACYLSAHCAMALMGRQLLVLQWTWRTAWGERRLGVEAHTKSERWKSCWLIVSVKSNYFKFSESVGGCRPIWAWTSHPNSFGGLSCRVAPTCCAFTEGKR